MTTYGWYGPDWKLIEFCWVNANQNSIKPTLTENQPNLISQLSKSRPNDPDQSLTKPIMTKLNHNFRNYQAIKNIKQINFKLMNS